MQIIPEISVIIPAYNEEQYLHDCLNSILDLNYPKEKYEIIVVDNGSTDNTVSIAINLSDQVILFPEGRTIAAVRNKGASVAKGKILAFLDADCLVAPNWLEAAVELLTGSLIGVVGARPIAPEKGSTWVQRARASVLVKSKNTRVSWLSSGNFIVKAELFQQAGGFDEKLETAEDVDLSFRLNRITTILYSPKIIVLHLREPRTLLEFFKKEVWHGKSAYEGVSRHGIRKEELLSVFVPLMFCAAIVLLIFAFCTGRVMEAVALSIISLGIPFLAAIRSVIKSNNFKRIVQFYLIDLTFIVARSFSFLLNINSLIRLKMK